MKLCVTFCSANKIVALESRAAEPHSLCIPLTPYATALLLTVQRARHADFLVIFHFKIQREKKGWHFQTICAV